MGLVKDIIKATSHKYLSILVPCVGFSLYWNGAIIHHYWFWFRIQFPVKVSVIVPLIQKD
jgi:hypothetical protein